MLRKINILLITVVFLLVFSGCPEFYTFNLFDGMDYVKLPTAEDFDGKTTEENLVDLNELIGSDSFIDEIAEDEEAQAVVEDYLASVYNDSSLPEDQQIEAAVLAADLQLGVSGADDLIDNIFGALQSMDGVGDTGTDSGDTISGLLQGVMPDSITGESDPVVQEELFVDMISGLVAADVLYQTLEGINDTPEDGSPAVTGGTVVDAAVAAMVTLIIDSDVIGGSTTEQSAAILWDVYQAAAAGEDLSTYPIAGFDPTQDLSTSITDLTYVTELATTAGIDINALFGTSA